MAAPFTDYQHPIPPEGVPYQPAWDGSGNDACLAWSAFLPDHMLLRARVGDGSSVVLASGDAVGAPGVVRGGGGGWVVAAPILNDGRWAVRCFAVTEGGEREELPSFAEGEGLVESVRLAPGDPGPFAAAAAADGTATLLRWTAGSASWEPQFAAPTSLHAERPAVHVDGLGAPVLAYDGWDGSGYGVYLQTATAVMEVSHGLPGWHLTPDVLCAADGAIWLAWVRVTDIRSPEGVVDSQNEIVVARVEAGKDGLHLRRRRIVDELSHGLTDTSPRPEGVWGYLGRRRHPMLVHAGGRPFLVWEQKRNHSGGTRDNVGVLWERVLEAEAVGEAAPAHCGALGYEVAGSKESADRDYWVACYRGAHTDEREVLLLRRGRNLSQVLPRYPASMWRGWTPVATPVEPTAPARPEVYVNGRCYRLYWFDLHCHSVLSADAEGEVDECYRTARRKAGIDGILITDNDHYLVPLSQMEWHTNLALAEELYEPGGFLPLIGYEWTSRPFVGKRQVVDHRSVLLGRPAQDIVRWNEAAGNAEALYSFVAQHDGFVHAHHQRWDLLGHPVEANVEAASSWDAYLHRDPSVYHEALDAGHRIGLIGGSDEHRRNPGLGGALTGVWAEELTRESVMEALAAHRCFATAGRKPSVWITANGAPMGGRLAADRIDFQIAVEAAEPMQSAALIRDGERIREWDCAGDTALASEHQDLPGAGTHWYYLAITYPGRDYDRRELPANLQQARGPFAWTSPIWVDA
jgi:hypothetical protein